MLDEACMRHGLPRVGTPSNSPHRAILQVLPLAIELARTPFNPYRCLEFLSIAGGPIPSYIARPLQSAVRRQPGLDGPLWQEAWLRIAEIRRAQLVAKGPTLLPDAELDAQLQADIETWKVWFEPTSTPVAGLSSKVIETICQRVESWAMRRAAKTEGYSLYDLAAKHAAELASIVNGFGSRLLTSHQLRKIVDTVIAEGASSIAKSAQESRWIAIDHPGQLWDAAGVVLWWGFSSPRRPVGHRDHWSDGELQSFSRAGIEIDNASALMLREAQSWRNPIINARKHLVLIKPRTVAGSLAFAHPIWDELTASVEGTSLTSVTTVTSQLFDREETNLVQEVIRLPQLQHAKLPLPVRDWRVAANLIKPREKESFTSLERALGCPLSWTLEYAANIRPGSLQAIAEGERLIGDFAHAVVAKLFSESRSWESPAAQARAKDIMNEMLPKIASTLLLPGNSVHLRKTRETIAAAVGHLVTLLNEAHLRVIDCEFTLDAAFGSATFAGTIDLLVKTREDRKVVLDLKWSRYPHSYRRKFVDGNALQLASYSWLITQQPETSGFSPVGFYMLRQSRLFANDPQVFPRDSAIGARSMSDTWDQATAEYDRTLIDLGAGKVVATGVTEGSHSPQPEDALIEPPCNICRFGHFCGVEQLE